MTRSAVPPDPGPMSGGVTNGVTSAVTSVRMLVPDVHGVVRAKAVSAAYFASLRGGRHPWAAPVLYGDVWQNLPADVEVPMGNAFLVPDLSTYTVLPWNPEVAVVICDVESDTGPAPTPRSAARRVFGSVAAAGYTALLGPEVEFYLLTPDGDGPHGGSAFGMQDWYSNEALSRLSGFVQDLFTYLPRLGVPVYEVFNEHGAGQIEINIEPTPGLRALDQTFLTKLATKELARAHGFSATYLSCPSNHPEHPPSGFHLHQTLLDDQGRNLFAGAGGDLSALGRSYVGGQLAHADGITGVAAATVTAYKRLRPGTYAPLRAAWGIDNRTAMVRAVLSGDSTRIENRLGASDANPYLLAAAQLAAGLDGITTGADPGPPVGHDAGADPAFARVPANLHDGVQAFAADQVLVHALGEDLAGLYCAVQRQVWQRYQFHVSDWEITEYRGVL